MRRDATAGGLENMAIVDFEHVVSEEERVVLWRAEELEHIGFDDESAIELAMEPSVDLHLARKLVRNGCSPSVAFRILL